MQQPLTGLVVFKNWWYMKISELQEILEKAKEEFGDVEVVIHKYRYTNVTEVIPIKNRTKLNTTKSLSKAESVEIY